MKKLIVLVTIIISIFVSIIPCFSATVLKDKSEAEQFKKDSVYADIDVKEQIVNKDATTDAGLRDTDDAINKFSVATATKKGDTYTNTWSNYTITFDEQTHNANDIYDFNADGIKYDFGVYFDDYSRIAVYYSRLSRDLNVVAANFAPKAVPDDVEIAGVPFKHVSLDVPYPYGIEKYNYYFRNVDGKLMVIETYHEDKYDKCRKYIERFEKVQ